MKNHSHKNMLYAHVITALALTIAGSVSHADATPTDDPMAMAAAEFMKEEESKESLCNWTPETAPRNSCEADQELKYLEMKEVEKDSERHEAIEKAIKIDIADPSLLGLGVGGR